MKIPPEIQKLFEDESDGLQYGEVKLTLSIRDWKPRYVVGREQSIYLTDELPEDRLCFKSL
jgi:hypothetical protein